jgi:GR25 family glycosyltransferase involved in LPS biosynthesis
MVFIIILIILLIFVILIHCSSKKVYITPKINGIDHIVWINLERSIERNISTQEKLKNIPTSNNRIEAIDGKNAVLMKKYKQNIKSKLSDYEFACLLSHIKAISFLSTKKGDYFLVLEDDVSFENFQYFNFGLDTIIKKAPPFDILMVFKTFGSSIKNLYSQWKKISSIDPRYPVTGAVAYVISRKGIETIMDNVRYDVEIDNFIYLNRDLQEADIFLYSISNTIIYKYNFFSVETKDSTIHSEHLSTQQRCLEFQLEEIKKNLPISSR